MNVSAQNTTWFTPADQASLLSDNSSWNSSAGLSRPNDQVVYIHSSLLLVINFISICSNLCVMYLYVTHSTLRTRPNVIVMSLTLSDLLFASLMFAFSLTSKTVRRGAQSITCVLINFVLINLSVTVSAWSLVALTTERYLSVHKPFQNRTNIPKRYFSFTVLLIWCFGFAMAGVMLAPWPKDSLTSTILCGGLVQYTAFTACLTVFVQAILPICIIAALYSSIARTARRHQRSIQSVEMQILMQNRTEPTSSPSSSRRSWFKHATGVAKGTKVLLYACLSLIITWSPIFVVLQVFVFCTNCDKEKMYYCFLFGSVVFHTKGFIHPLAYTLRDQHYKEAARKTVTSIFSSCSGGRSSVT